jgi:hypothetical protein
MVFRALLLAALLSAQGAEPALNEAPPCIVFAGGFLREELPPDEATVEFRDRVWMAYKEHSSTCIELRLTSREGVATATIFYSEIRQRAWVSKIEVSRPENEGEPSSALAIQKISRVEKSTNRPLENESQAAPSSYRLVFHLNNGHLVER